MRALVYLVSVAAALAAPLWSQAMSGCACGGSAPAALANRELHPYAGAPQDVRPYSNFTTPYYEHYTKLVEYNGAARAVPVPPLDSIEEIRIGFLGPV